MRSFTAVEPDEFVQLVSAYPWTRQILEVHLHHTWRPSRTHYDGLRTIEGMWRYHTQTNGWSDIAQHVTTAPDGKIWIGRNFNWSPASATGHNGNATSGPFMIEMIGDFDIGRDEMSDAQYRATLAVIRAVQMQFGLPPSALRFHNEMSGKTCPGSQIDKAAWIEALQGFALPGIPADSDSAAFPEAVADQSALIESMRPHMAQTDSLADAEHPLEAEMAASAAREIAASRGGGSGSGSGGGLSGSGLTLLADHVINLTGGKFSRSGVFSTSAADVDRIVNERLAALVEAAAAGGEPARILLYAHGGLTSERHALAGAMDQLDFWRANNIYPIFLVWETGLGETLKFMLRNMTGLERAPRGMVREWLDDKIEDAVRFAGGDRIWSAMKRNAELANAKDGGAAYAASAVAKLVRAARGKAELHLAGHSAGSNFLAHLLGPLGNVPITSVHLMAPAITNAQFHGSLAAATGKTIKALTVYTMRKPLELADSVTPLYAKSLLYMIANALEPARPEAILGLEDSLRGDPAAARFFGLGGHRPGAADIVWSPSPDGESGSGNASEARTHGDFDNDKATLESICRRITGRTAGEPIAAYRGGGARGGDVFSREIDFPDDLGRFIGPEADAAGAGPLPAPCPPVSMPPATDPAPYIGSSGGAGRKLALCIGIDDYPHISPLECCRRDVETWRAQLEALGFTVEVMAQQEATSEGIRQRLGSFVDSARAGDRLVFQYSGHGTLVSDTSGDELKDSCLCAWDCNNPGGVGGLVLDDELFALMNAIHADAQLTGFIDCCHSGTMARALLSPALSPLPRDARARSVAAEPAMVAAYQARARGARESAPADARLKAVFFNACQDAQLAYEFGGSGHFTRVAAPLLASAQGLTNAGFAERIIQGFGANPRQLPALHCDPGKRQSQLALF